MTEPSERSSISAIGCQMKESETSFANTALRPLAQVLRSRRMTIRASCIFGQSRIITEPDTPAA